MFEKLASRPFFLLICAVTFWSGNFIVGRAVRNDMEPLELAFWRWVFAAIIALYLARHHLKRDLPNLIKAWPVVLLLSFTGVCCFNTLVYMGLQSTVAVNGLLLQSMIPVLIVVFSFLFFREKIRFIQFLGVLVSLLGVVCIVSQGDLGSLQNLELNKGDGIVFLAVISYAVYSVFLRKRPVVHPLSFVAASFVLGTFMLFPIYLLEIGRFALPSNGASLMAIAYVAIFPSIVSYLCFNRGVELIGANKAGMFIHLMPVFGSLMAIAFLGERLYLFHLVGIACIGCGIYLATKREG